MPRTSRARDLRTGPAARHSRQHLQVAETGDDDTLARLRDALRDAEYAHDRLVESDVVWLGRNVDHKKRFCSLACQRETERRANVERWLRTGNVPSVGNRAGHYIRRYLFDEQSGRCAMCAIGAEWNGQPLSLVLDHIDGDASHNGRDNLRLVCPNCDSQLRTFKSRNRGNGRAWRRQRYAEGKSY